MGVPLIAGIALLAAGGWALSRAFADDSSEGKPIVGPDGTHYDFALPANASLAPGDFGQYAGGGVYDDQYNAVPPDSAPGNVFFGFVQQPSPIDVRRSLSVGDLVTVTLMKTVPNASSGRNPVMLGWFEVMRRYSSEESLLEGAYDLAYRGIANENSDMAESAPPSPNFALTAVSPEYVGNFVAHRKG